MTNMFFISKNSYHVTFMGLQFWQMGQHFQLAIVSTIVDQVCTDMFQGRLFCLLSMRPLGDDISSRGRSVYNEVKQIWDNIGSWRHSNVQNVNEFPFKIILLCFQYVFICITILCNYFSCLHNST